MICGRTTLKKHACPLRPGFDRGLVNRNLCGQSAKTSGRPLSPQQPGIAPQISPLSPEFASCVEGEGIEMSPSRGSQSDASAISVLMVSSARLGGTWDLPRRRRCLSCPTSRRGRTSLLVRTGPLRRSGPSASPRSCRSMSSAPWWTQSVGPRPWASAPVHSRTPSGCGSTGSGCRPPPTSSRRGSPLTGPGTCPPLRPFFSGLEEGKNMRQAALATLLRKFKGPGGLRGLVGAMVEALRPREQRL
jgi:hypothetical protein